MLQTGVLDSRVQRSRNSKLSPWISSQLDRAIISVKLFRSKHLMKACRVLASILSPRVSRTLWILSLKVNRIPHRAFSVPKARPKTVEVCSGSSKPIHKTCLKVSTLRVRLANMLNPLANKPSRHLATQLSLSSQTLLVSRQPFLTHSYRRAILLVRDRQQ